MRQRKIICIRRRCVYRYSHIKGTFIERIQHSYVYFFHEDFSAHFDNTSHDFDLGWFALGAAWPGGVTSTLWPP
jgi:hypothetical protein